MMREHFILENTVVAVSSCMFVFWTSSSHIVWRVSYYDTNSTCIVNINVRTLISITYIFLQSDCARGVGKRFYKKQVLKIKINLETFLKTVRTVLIVISFYKRAFLSYTNLACWITSINTMHCICNNLQFSTC